MYGQNFLQVGVVGLAVLTSRMYVGDPVNHVGVGVDLQSHQLDAEALPAAYSDLTAKVAVQRAYREYGYKTCPHCHGYGSSLKDPEDVNRCTVCGGDGLAKGD